MIVGSQAFNVSVLIAFRLLVCSRNTRALGQARRRELWCLNHVSTRATLWQSFSMCDRSLHAKRGPACWAGHWGEAQASGSSQMNSAASTAHVWCSYLMVKPGAGDLGSPSVSQDIVLHAFHTGVFSHFGAEGGLVLFHFWQEKKQTQGI